jgi:hypothetical protein
MIDFGYARSRLNLCGNCTLAMSSLVITNDRKGNGVAIDFIANDAAPQQWARVLLRNALRLRAACVEPRAGVTQALTFVRPPWVAGRQAASLRDRVFRGKPYPGSFTADDVAYRSDRVNLEGSGWAGGYDLVGFWEARA